MLLIIIITRQLFVRTVYCTVFGRCESRFGEFNIFKPGFLFFIYYIKKLFFWNSGDVKEDERDEK